MIVLGNPSAINLSRNVTVPQYIMHYHIYLRCQQERGLMQRARRLMDENGVSFQMFLILLSSITLGSESQMQVFNKSQSNTYKPVLFCFFVRGKHAQKPKFGDIRFFSEKKNFIRHFAGLNFSRLSLALILKYCPILHAVKRLLD